MQEARSKVIERVEPPKTASQAQAGKKVVHFMGEIKQEFKRIEWTSKEEIRAYTKIVLGSTFFFGMAVYFSDLAIQGVLKAIHTLVAILVG